MFFLSMLTFPVGIVFIASLAAMFWIGSCYFPLLYANYCLCIKSHTYKSICTGSIGIQTVGDAIPYIFWHWNKIPRKKEVTGLIHPQFSLFVPNEMGKWTAWIITGTQVFKLDCCCNTWVKVIEQCPTCVSSHLC